MFNLRYLILYVKSMFVATPIKYVKSLFTIVGLCLICLGLCIVFWGLFIIGRGFVLSVGAFFSLSGFSIVCRGFV